MVAGTRRLFVVFALLAALPILADCGEGARASDPLPVSLADVQRPAVEQTTDGQAEGGRAVEKEQVARKRSEDVDTRAGGDAGARAGNAAAGPGGGAERAKSGVDVGKKAGQPDRHGQKSSRKKVVLDIKGDHGTKFTGACSVGGEERQIGGRAPQRYTFGPEGEKLACEVHEDGPGTLKVVLTVGNDVRSVQQSGPGESDIRLTLSDGGISISQSSSSGSGSQTQSMSSSQISSNSTSTR